MPEAIEYGERSLTRSPAALPIKYFDLLRPIEYTQLQFLARSSINDLMLQGILRAVCIVSLSTLEQLYIGQLKWNGFTVEHANKKSPGN